MPRGRPRTTKERKERHKQRFGTDELPPRGTGRLRNDEDDLPRGRGYRRDRRRRYWDDDYLFR